MNGLRQPLLWSLWRAIVRPANPQPPRTRHVLVVLTVVMVGNAAPIVLFITAPPSLAEQLLPNPITGIAMIGVEPAMLAANIAWSAFEEHRRIALSAFADAPSMVLALAVLTPWLIAATAFARRIFAILALWTAVIARAPKHGRIVT